MTRAKPLFAKPGFGSMPIERKELERTEPDGSLRFAEMLRGAFERRGLTAVTLASPFPGFSVVLVQPAASKRVRYASAYVAVTADGRFDVTLHAKSGAKFRLDFSAAIGSVVDEIVRLRAP